MNNNKEYSELKKKALLAKQRLKMGYWERIQNEKEFMLNSVGDTDDGRHVVSSLQREKLQRENLKVTNLDEFSREEYLYKKVSAILDEDENVSNPIGLMMEKDYYDTLDDGGRQRYVWQLSDAFRRLSERYYREKELERKRLGTDNG